ncbi:MAG: hypothetical protein EPN93_16615 [Spirochaetes bacterium]|nr:MAG: hypothetical protein EPN93_16615 [Spirochaetota bacterium]
MKKVMWSICVSICAVLLVFASTAFAAEEGPKHFLLLGADTPFSPSLYEGSTPIVSYRYFMRDPGNNLYGEYGLDTTLMFFILSRKTDSIQIGIKPQFGMFTYSAYSDFDRGLNYPDRNFAGYAPGVEVFLENKWGDYFTTKVKYLAAYYLYRENERGAVGRRTQIDLPNEHLEHKPGGEFQIGKVVTEDIGRIKSGAMIKARYEYSRRVGYGTWVDVLPGYALGDPSGERATSIEDTHKFWAKAGLYKNRRGYTLQMEISGAYHTGVDRNNAEAIGSFNPGTEFSKIPGYYIGEFRHSEWAVSNIVLGMPIAFWNSRIAVGFYALYMPQDNRVIGQQDYPRELYRSVTLGLSTLLADALPFGISYGYGIDARRSDQRYQDVLAGEQVRTEKGNHEVFIYVYAAF